MRTPSAREATTITPPSQGFPKAMMTRAMMEKTVMSHMGKV